MADKVCTGDCLKCSLQQQVYCAAQHGHAIMALFPVIVARLERIEAGLAEFGKTSDIINPLQEQTQYGTGVENRVPETIKRQSNE